MAKMIMKLPLYLAIILCIVGCAHIVANHPKAGRLSIYHGDERKFDLRIQVHDINNTRLNAGILDTPDARFIYEIHQEPDLSKRLITISAKFTDCGNVDIHNAVITCLVPQSSSQVTGIVKMLPGQSVKLKLQNNISILYSLEEL